MAMKRKSMRPTLYYIDTRPPKETISRIQACRNHPSGQVEGVVGEKGYWTAYRREFTMTVLGDKMFYKPGVLESLTYKDGKFHGEMTHYLLEMACKALHIDWIESSGWCNQV